MKDLLNNLVAYLKYLRYSCGLAVSVHFSRESLHSLPREAMAAILRYNSHDNPYCIAVKREHHGECMFHQARLIREGEKRRVIRVCHAGVREIIYPIQPEGRVIGFATVSGYREEPPPKTCEGAQLSLWREALCGDEPPLPLCDTLLPPLCMMMERLFHLYAEKGKDEYNMILQYLNEYHGEITLEDVCRHFHRSPSYISHFFKKQSGKSIRAYCNERKLEDACHLLRSTGLSVTQIAYDVGFCDASYFIGLFRKKFGVSPLQYRKQTENTTS